MTKILSSKEKKSILNKNYVGNLSYMYHNEPFVVPITYLYDEEQNHIICYSRIDHKINALRKKKAVTLSVSAINSESKLESVLVKGKYRERSGSGAKAILHQFSLGVKKIILNNQQKKLEFINEFSSKTIGNDIPVVFTIEIEEITSKLLL